MDSGIVRVSIAAMVMLATFGTTRAQEAAKLAVTGPVLSNTGPDAAAYGADEGFPLGTLATASQMQHLVAAYSHFDELTPARIVPRAASPWSFQRAAEPEISYTFGGERHTIMDYLNRQPTTGLLIARDDTILYEHYRYARSERDRFLSQSMAKTITRISSRKGSRDRYTGEYTWCPFSQSGHPNDPDRFHAGCRFGPDRPRPQSQSAWRKCDWHRPSSCRDGREAP